MRAAWALAPALAASACALGPAKPPSATVLGVRLAGLGLTEQRLAVTLCVTNPNGSELAFRQVDMALDVSGAPLLAASSDVAVRVPPLSSAAVPFTVATTVRNLPQQIGAILRDGSLAYRVHGTVTLAGGLGLTLPFSRSGRLDPLAGGLDLASAATSGEPEACR